jgi:hypothetical protein
MAMQAHAVAGFPHLAQEFRVAQRFLTDHEERRALAAFGQ